MNDTQEHRNGKSKPLGESQGKGWHLA